MADDRSCRRPRLALLLEIYLRSRGTAGESVRTQGTFHPRLLSRKDPCHGEILIEVRGKIAGDFLRKIA